MPTFEIPDGPTTVELKRTGDAKNPGPATGSIQFTVKNTSTDVCAGRLSVVPSGNSKKEWFTIDGDAERNIPAGETTTAMIKISAPKDVAAGDYPFRLRAVAVNDPDNDHAEGPVSTAKVPPVPKDGGGGIPWWVWLIIGLVVLAALGAGGYFVFGRKHAPPAPPEENVVENNTSAPVVMAAVPDFTGKTVEDAKADAHGFNISEQPGTPSKKPPRTILSQAPAAGSQQATGAIVQVTFDPGVTVPSVMGQDAAAALQNLQRVPLHVERTFTRCEPSGTPGQIVDQDPKPGANVASDSGVNITLRSIGGVFGRGLRIPCGRAIPKEEMLQLSPKISPKMFQPR